MFWLPTLCRPLHRLLLFLVSVLLTGCKTEIETIEIDCEDANEVWFEDVANEVKIVPLISDEPIGSIKNMICSGNEIIALDNDGKTIYYFEDGTLVSKMNHLGRGHGEYLEIKRYAYLPSRKILFVLSGNSVLWYSLPQMNFVGDTKVDFLIQYFSLHNDDTFFASINHNGKTETVLIDINTGKIIKEIEEISMYCGEESDISMSSYSTKRHYYAKEGSDNTIVFVNNSNVAIPIIKYNFGANSIPDKYLDYSIGNITGLAELMQYMIENGDTRLQGNQLLRVDDEEVSFWYYHSMGSFEKFFYRFNVKNQTYENLKGFRIMGINKPVYPIALSDNGYVSLFDGNYESFLSNEKPCELAESIILEMKKQKLNNPVLLFYNIE